jgi:hypothetical protein
MVAEEFGDRGLHETGCGDPSFYGQDFGASDEIGVDVDQELAFFRRSV